VSATRGPADARQSVRIRGGRPRFSAIHLNGSASQAGDDRRVPAAAPGLLRVATYNIHKGVLREFFGLKRIPRIHELRARLHELDADLVFLQEVQGRHDRYERRFEGWPPEQQDIFLARSPSLRHTFETAYGKNATYLHGHHGNALLSRFPILSRENRDVSDHLLERRGLLHCVVQVGEVRVHCFVVHFGLFAGSRERQTAALIEWIQREVPPGAPLIVAGDFNDWRDKLSRNLCDALNVCEVFDALKPRGRVAQQVADYMADRLAGLGVAVEKESFRLPRTVRTARTFPALVPWLRMDRIYQRGFKVRHAEVLRGPTWARLSDHSPVIADLEPS
jgi:endonuclease/exonuclease/phosphatase family metal-dependent hydrolase